VRFKSNLYTELQAQRTQAELDLKRSEPVLTMVERPVPPLEPVAPQWLLIIVLSIIMGTVLGVSTVLIRAYFSGENTTGKRRAKLQEVRNAFFPERIMSAVEARLPTLKPQDDETAS
jgi:capsular polysaccharide biosynthesis protein